MIEALKKIEVEAFCKKGTEKSYRNGAAVAILKVDQLNSRDLLVQGDRWRRSESS
jgi:hypothetical protein